MTDLGGVACDEHIRAIKPSTEPAVVGQNIVDQTCDGLDP
jgi:hypothetical protein